MHARTSHFGYRASVICTILLLLVDPDVPLHARKWAFLSVVVRQRMVTIHEQTPDHEKQFLTSTKADTVTANDTGGGATEGKDKTHGTEEDGETVPDTREIARAGEYERFRDNSEETVGTAALPQQ